MWRNLNKYNRFRHNENLLFMSLYGRQEEIALLNEMLKSNAADLLLVTGRRRVGKTFLLNHVLSKVMHFSFTGTQDATAENQLQKFDEKIHQYNKRKKQPQSNNWREAFIHLKNHLTALPNSNKKKVVFFDEFPWIDHHNSKFLNEFSYWWNDWASKQNILVAITGSATTWMIKRIIHNRGGMHNRVTKRMHLLPFTLAETKQMVKGINPKLVDYDIMQLYMCLGGIPLYLQQIKKGETASQSIYNICIKNNSFLQYEFTDLYASLFDNFENHIAVINALHKKWIGLTRNEIVTYSKLSDGGGLSRILEELEASNFIIQIPPIFSKKKGMIYRLADEYSRFYLTFIKNKKNANAQAWQNTAQYKAWQGYAFENICIKHIEAIKKELSIAGMQTSIASFYTKLTPQHKSFQIDLLIDRADNAINLCEMKFYNKAIAIDKKFVDTLRTKRASFLEFSKTKKTIFNTVISSFGTDKNSIISSEIDHSLTMDCLFKLQNF